MVISPPLVLTHPRLPGIELHRGPRSGAAYLIALAVPLDRQGLADAGRWLLEQSGEDLSRSER